MLTADLTETATPLPMSEAARDYDLIRRAIAFMSAKWRDQPAIDTIADRLGLTAPQLHQLFRRWCGLTPKAFMQAITLDHARHMLRNEASVLDTALEVGLSGPGRLHDLFVTHEAMSPGDYKTGGEGLVLRHGFHPAPFGTAVVITTERGLAGLAFCDAGEEAATLADMMRRWPKARTVQDQAVTAPVVPHIFGQAPRDIPLRLVLIGSDFEVSVWQSLLKIPLGQATTYGTIASHIGRPRAARAVGAAVGRNPICFVVPCHRVLGKSGALTGYHWGLTRKQAILGWEAGKLLEHTPLKLM